MVSQSLCGLKRIVKMTCKKNVERGLTFVFKSAATIHFYSVHHSCAMYYWGKLFRLASCNMHEANLHIVGLVVTKSPLLLLTFSLKYTRFTLHVTRVAEQCVAHQ